MTNISDIFGIGVLIFNPHDDEFHIERIVSCIKSVIVAVRNSSKRVKLLVLFNNSYIQHIGKNGVGPETEKIVSSTLEYSNINYTIISKKYNNSMAVGYNILFKSLYKDKVKYISILADDYIMPSEWFNIVYTEFQTDKTIDYIIPSTTFVAQKNLLVPLKVKENWTLNYVGNDGEYIGVSKGITLSDVNHISSSCQKFSYIKHVGPPSFETSIFKYETVKKYGFLCEDYYLLFFNSEYFIRMKAGNGRGIISRKSFIFHYGKGGTKAIFKDTGDEKYKDSPMEKYLLSDIRLFNTRNNRNIEVWWNKSPNIVGHPNNVIIIFIMIKYHIYSILKGSIVEKYAKKLIGS